MAPRRLRGPGARIRLAITLLALPALPAARCPLAPRAEPLVMAVPVTGPARTWELFETAGNVWGDFENPFDPDEVSLTGEFRAPDGGVVTTPGFATRSYARTLVGGAERLVAPGPLHWAVRFAFPRPGTWRWRWVVATAQGDAATDWRTVDVAPATPGAHGFVRRSPADGRYLRFDDGTPYVAIGENTGWADARGTFAYDDWFAKLAAQGASFARVWMASWSFGLEWGDALGDYTTRLDRAWQLDRVLAAAARHGIHVVVCLQNHGAFSLEANSEWADNPYNAARGGPLTAPEQVFDDATARALFRRRLRYVVARWGWSPHVLAWELWNEVDLVPPSAAVVPWHVEMARLLRELDPNDHLVTTSLARGEASPLWSLPEIDLLQIHHYAFPFALDIPSIVALRLDAQAAAHPGKPRLLGEYGTDYRGPAETLALDPESIGFHQGLWIGLLAGGYGTGMSWWWDNLVDPEDLYGHFRPIAEVVDLVRAHDGVAFDAQHWVTTRPAASAAGRDLAAYALRGRTAVVAWLQNRAHQWSLPPLPGPDPTPVVGATVALSGLPDDGAWTALWIDAYTAERLATRAVPVTGGAVVLEAPTFSRDVALVMLRGDIGAR